MAKEKEVENKEYKVVQVATQTENVIVDSVDEQKSVADLLVEIANDVKTLKKHLVG